MSTTLIGEGLRMAPPLTLLSDFVRELQAVIDATAKVHISLSRQASEFSMAVQMAEQAHSSSGVQLAAAQNRLKANVLALSDLDLLIRCQVAAFGAIAGEVHTLAREAQNVSYALIAAVGGGEALRRQSRLLASPDAGKVVALHGHKSDGDLFDRISRRITEIRERLNSVLLRLEHQSATQQKAGELIGSVQARLTADQPDVELELVEA